MSAVREAHDTAHHAARQVTTSHGLDRLARVGMICRGVLYALIGILALQVAFGSGGHEADKGGAVNAVAGQPFGKALLWLMAVGFAALALWRLSRALFVRGETAERIEDAGRTAVYVLLVATMVKVVWSGGQAESSDQQSTDATRALLDLPGGQALVGAIGAGVIALGGYWIYQGMTRKFLAQLRTEQMSARTRSTVARLGLAGYVARGLVAVGGGVFILLAAVRYDPQQAKGIDDTLRSFTGTPAGPWLLVAVAAGLILFAGYCLSEARWHRANH